MSNLFELVRSAKALDLMLEEREGEITESDELMIYNVQLSLTQKTDACAAYHEHLESELAKWEEKVKEVNSCKKRAADKLKRFEEYLIHNLKEMNGKIKGDYSELSIKETSGNLIITGDVPEQYKSEVITKEIIIDKKSLKQDLSLGVPVEGAKIVTNYSLKIKSI